MTPIIWPTLDNNGMPSWVRANRANEQAYVRKVPARTALRPGAGVVPLGFAAHRRNHTCSILALLVLVAVIALRRRR